MRRALIVAAAAVAAAGVFAVTRPDAPRPVRPSAAPTTGTAAPADASPPQTLLLARKTEIVRVDVDSGKREMLADLPSASVYASPLTRWIAYVTSGPEDDDFATHPELFLYDPVSGRTSPAGPGLAPVWSADGTRVAFLRPVEPRDCFGEQCAGAVVIGIVEPGTSREATVFEPGRYSILGWAGDRVLVSDFDDTSRIVVASPDGGTAFLDLAPSELWEASPDGRWVVVEGPGGTELRSLDGTALGAETIPVDLGGRSLLEVRWSPDSARVAALAARRGRPAAAQAIVLFSPDAPEAAPLDGTRGALGGLVWSRDGRAIAYAGVGGERSSRLDAFVCDVRRGHPCEPVSSWRSGVTILRIE